MNEGIIKYNPNTADFCVRYGGNLRTTPPCNNVIITPKLKKYSINTTFKILVIVPLFS